MVRQAEKLRMGPPTATARRRSSVPIGRARVAAVPQVIPTRAAATTEFVLHVI